MSVRVRLAGAYVAGLCLAGLLTACAVIDPVDSRYDTVSRSLAKARNESILLNLIRASHDYPLSFVTVANVTPTMTNTTTLGLPNFLFGPNIGAPTTVSLFTPGRDVIFGNTTASNATAVGTNFNVSTQETSTFYEGFLKPIDLQILDYFIRQGYSRELLFWLFTDSVEVTAGGRTFGTRYNPPNDYGCPAGDMRQRCFGEFVQIAVAAGLTVEEKSQQQIGGGSSSSGKGGGGGDKSGGGGGKTTTIIFPRFCFSSVLQQQAKRSMPEGHWEFVTRNYFDSGLATFSPVCGAHWDPTAEVRQWQADTFNFNAGVIKFKIVPRSAYGVFEFLGTLIRMQTEHVAPATSNIPPGRLEDLSRPPYLWTAAPNEDNQLITVVLAAGQQRCFVHSWFYDGDYCVPETATNTKKIFSLLAQLIAITTAATDLSITPVVRVIQ
jgi:uncharacterized membrane protein YgcG